MQVNYLTLTLVNTYLYHTANLKLKGQCVGIKAMQSRMISQPMKSLM